MEGPEGVRHAGGRGARTANAQIALLDVFFANAARRARAATEKSYENLASSSVGSTITTTACDIDKKRTAISMMKEASGVRACVHCCSDRSRYSGIIIAAALAAARSRNGIHGCLGPACTQWKDEACVQRPRLRARSTTGSSSLRPARGISRGVSGLIGALLRSPPLLGAAFSGVAISATAGAGVAFFFSFAGDDVSAALFFVVRPRCACTIAFDDDGVRNRLRKRLRCVWRLRACAR